MITNLHLRRYVTTLSLPYSSIKIHILCILNQNLVSKNKIIHSRSLSLIALRDNEILNGLITFTGIIFVGHNAELGMDTRYAFKRKAGQTGTQFLEKNDVHSSVLCTNAPWVTSGPLALWHLVNVRAVCNALIVPHNIICCLFL